LDTTSAADKCMRAIERNTHEGALDVTVDSISFISVTMYAFNYRTCLKGTSQ